MEKNDMSRLRVQFQNETGTIKPMHATNNGPVVPLKNLENGTLHPFNNNLAEFANAGIPYARTHDSSFYHRYGMEHTVDVYYVFPNFDADPEDPVSYDFACTDHYLRGCELAGCEVFYRLGHRIEHEVKKYGTHPPKDFKKWAVICEHIIRHYNEGWADGYHMNITYWEIWNEPDLHWENWEAICPTWRGTKEQFFELYHITATHLKECFPHLKIGGPALAGDLEWAEMFLAQLKAPMDFFSWHRYDHTVEGVVDRVVKVKALLEKYGYGNVESILNEWNYVLAWQGDGIVYSHEQRRLIKGAAYSSAVMCACQYSPVDMLMYYDARPNEFWNGMFDDMVVGRVLKGYYPFPMFNTLYRLGRCVETSVSDGDAYICAAKNEHEAAIILTRFNDDDTTPVRTVSVEMNGLGSVSGVDVEVFVLDEVHNLESVGRMTYYGDRFVIEKKMPNFTSYLLKLKKNTI